MGGLKPVFLRPTEMFVTYFKVSLIAGFILSMPIIIYQLIRFVAPGLTQEEKKDFQALLRSVARSGKARAKQTKKRTRSN